MNSSSLDLNFRDLFPSSSYSIDSCLAEFLNLLSSKSSSCISLIDVGACLTTAVYWILLVDKKLANDVVLEVLNFVFFLKGIFIVF